MMAEEIEDRFLVFNLPSLAGLKPQKILQGYLHQGGKGATVRVRTIDDQMGLLTVKGKRQAGARAEFEYPVPVQDARDMLRLCGPATLSKDRYLLPGPDGRTWELDIFTGRHAGLVIAEIELDYAGQPYAKVPWAGPDISDDGRLGNAAIARSNMPDILKAMAVYKSQAGGLKPVSP